jgi:hypothetical protein
MVDRIAREREHDLRLAAQAVYNAEVAEAAKEFRREKDAAYLRRDLGYDALRNRAADLRRMQPRTTRYRRRAGRDGSRPIGLARVAAPGRPIPS